MGQSNNILISQKMATKKCQKHSKEFVELCLAEDCKADLFLCPDCKDVSQHKHSKTDIVSIEDIKSKLKHAWQPKDSIIEVYFKKTAIFYESLRKQVAKVIQEDQKSVEIYLTKVKYHHLPFDANSLSYLAFLKEDYDKLDRMSILRLVNEAESGQLNRNLQKQKQISSFLDVQLQKINDKVLTLKYVLLSKKLEGQLLSPTLTEESKVAYPEDFVKLYSLFNSRNMMIRSAKLIYRASENGSATSFYNRCNGVPNCVALVKTSNNKLVGGFTPLPLVHHDSDQLEEELCGNDQTKTSFIFSLSSLKSFSLRDCSKAIIYRKGSCGPQFSQDLDINKVVTSSIGHSYEGTAGIARDSLQARAYLLESVKAQIKDMEIWQLSF